MTLLAVESVDARHGLLQAVRDVVARANGGRDARARRRERRRQDDAPAHDRRRAPPGLGRILFEGRDITSSPPHKRVRAGITLVPEGRRLFTNLTVEENLALAARAGRPGPWTVAAVLETFPMLEPLRRRRAGRLSGGEQQATAIGRALMTNPRVLLLDEVSLGLAPVAVEGVYASLRSLIERGTTTLLVEQDLSRALSVANRVACMLEGRIVLEGPAAEMTREQIVDAYFGLGRSRRNGGPA